jgi:hypothetical protein
VAFPRGASLSVTGQPALTIFASSSNQTSGLVKSELKPDAGLSLALSFADQQGSCRLLMLPLYPSQGRLSGSAIKEERIRFYGTSSKIATNI